MSAGSNNVLIKDLREGFRQYLEVEYAHLQDRNVVLSDAFYLNRHNVGIGFWEALRSEETMERCREKLEDYFTNVRKAKTPRSNSYSYLRSMKILKEYIDKIYGGVQGTVIEGTDNFEQKTSGSEYRVEVVNNEENRRNKEVLKPSVEEVDKYLKIWDGLDNYTLQESALERLFFGTYPKNTDIDDVIIKVSSLNDFYSTNIFSPFTMAKHIVDLDIDDRLQINDVTLVSDIGRVKMDNGNVINFYSFATKYCSHHKPLDFPIYDSYVDKILRHFRDHDNFYTFKTAELREYPAFKEILVNFRKYYGLEAYSLKDIDRYLWQLGKEKFPHKY